MIGVKEGGAFMRRCGRCSPAAVWLIGCGLGILLGVLISAAAAAILLGLACIVAGLLLFRK